MQHLNWNSILEPNVEQLILDKIFEPNVAINLGRREYKNLHFTYRHETDKMTFIVK